MFFPFLFPFLLRFFLISHIQPNNSLHLVERLPQQGIENLPWQPYFSLISFLFRLLTTSELWTTPNQHTPYFDFWDRYKDKLLRFINTPQIQNHKRKIEDVLDQLKELNEKLSKEIKGVIGKYREEYDLTQDEIDPKLKELLDW